MRKSVAWPGVAVKTAKGRTYHYWSRSKPWTRLPNPATDPDGFMRKLAHLQRVSLRVEAARAGTLADTARLYQKHPDFTSKAANTREAYRASLGFLIETFPAAAMNEITPQLVQEFVMDEDADRPGRANMNLSVLRVLYRWAAKRRAGLVDPTKGIEHFASKDYDPWPDDALASALASNDARFRLAVALHLYTGQRTGDVCAMTWESISDTADYIPVRQEKTEKHLEIPVHPELAGHLAAAPRAAATILSNREGKPLQRATFRQWVTDYRATCGVRLVPHGLRKNAVNALLESGCSTAEVSSITGQSLAIVEHYGKARNQARIASTAMLKWGRARNENGKTS